MKFYEITFRHEATKKEFYRVVAADTIRLAKVKAISGMAPEWKIIKANMIANLKG